MQIFPDASPDRPVYLSCECGERVTLTAPPETWPLPCVECGKPVRVVNPETVGVEPAPEDDPKLLSAPGGGASLAPRSAGLPAEREEEYVELEARSFTGKRIRERVAVRPPETFGSETLALALWLAASVAIMMGYAIVIADFEFTVEGLLATSAIFAVVTLAFTAAQGRVVRPTLCLPRGFWCLIATAGVPIGVILVALYFKLLEDGSGSSFSSDAEDAFRDPNASLPLMILGIGILPGIFEELGFRGWMQSAWKLVLPSGRALILTACAFTVIHFSYYSIGWLLPFALYLGWLRERSGSIWPGVIAHMGHNTAMVLFVRYSG